MGQYFRGAVLKKNHKLAKQPVLFALRPSEFNNTAKLMEHSYIGNHYVNAYMEMISDADGIYFGYPFVWVGDYADNVKDKDYYNFANIATNKYIDYSDKLKGVKEYKYLVNFSKKEYVIIPKYNPAIWQMHPLSLLTAYGNGRGNGDYYGADEENVGRWAFNRIGATNSESWLQGMKEIEIGFEPDF